MDNMREKKEKLSQAKAMVINGDTLKETSKKTGLSIDTLKKYSSKENWLELQETYFIKMTDDMIRAYGEEHIKARARAIKILSDVINRTAEEMEKNEIDGKKLKQYSDITDIVTKAVKGQTSLLEIQKIEDFYHNEYLKQTLEFKKERAKGSGDGEKVGAFLDRLEDFII